MASPYLFTVSAEVILGAPKPVLLKGCVQPRDRVGSERSLGSTSAALGASALASPQGTPQVWKAKDAHLNAGIGMMTWSSASVNGIPAPALLAAIVPPRQASISPDRVRDRDSDPAFRSEAPTDIAIGRSGRVPATAAPLRVGDCVRFEGLYSGAIPDGWQAGNSYIIAVTLRLLP
jgi:hypothetical protein